MNINKRISKFQDGGAAPAADPSQGAPAQDPSQGGAPQDGSQQDPMMQLVQLAQQALQGQDCNAAMSVCQGLLSVIQQLQGGQGGQGAAPAQDQQQGAPVFQKGGKLVRRITN